MVNKASQALTRIAQKDQPFFMAVGLYKPHLPFHVHQRFWNRFKTFQTTDAAEPSGPEPRSSFLSFMMDADSDVTSFRNNFNPWNSLDSDSRLIMRTGYLAAIAQTDDAIGMRGFR